MRRKIVHGAQETWDEEDDEEEEKPSTTKRSPFAPAEEYAYLDGMLPSPGVARLTHATIG